MPSVHCHLPQEEVEKVPEQDVIEVAAASETEEQEMDGEILIITDDDESADGAEGGTSSEASSMLNDPTIQPWVPVVSSSDENESEAGGFWTPPSTMGDDAEEAGANTTTVRRGFQRTNTARRSRARLPGVSYMRRGRYRQPLAEQESYRLTAFERGITFNGFARNLEPEVITDHMVEQEPREILYNVKWRSMREAKLIEASVMHSYKPEMVIEYWEKKVRRELL